MLRLEKRTLHICSTDFAITVSFDCFEYPTICIVLTFAHIHCEFPHFPFYAGLISGVISERDYVNKMALLGRNSKETKIKEISTKSANLITASPHDSVDGCMQKMLSKDIRHLPLLDDEGKVVGILSIKDLVKATVQHQEETIKILSDFALGRGGHFGSD